MLRALIEDAVELSCLAAFLAGLAALVQPALAPWAG